jgi:hypothetical protein
MTYIFTLFGITRCALVQDLCSVVFGRKKVFFIRTSFLLVLIEPPKK